MQKQEGAPHPRQRRLCLFSHFDSQGKIDPYVIYYLDCLQKLGTDIIFISTSKDLPATEISKVMQYCIQFIHRKNLSLDFGSWKIGLLEAKNLKSYDQLILANDSVYGPLFPLGSVFETMESRNLDFWGITNSQERRPHLQSYFLVFNKKAFTSAAFREFWDGFKYYRSKYRIITCYELGLSLLAEREKWKMGAYLDYPQTSRAELNPTLHHWDTLIDKFRCPFLKTESLKLNRVRSPAVNRWKEIVRNNSDYNTDLIEDHLGRMKSKH